MVWGAGRVVLATACYGLSVNLIRNKLGHVPAAAVAALSLGLMSLPALAVALTGPGLSVASAHRGRNLAFRLMRHALEFVIERGGVDIVAMGHSNVVKLYENNGMKVFHDESVTHGETVYFPMHMNVVATATAFAKKIKADVEEEHGDEACYHGGQSWEASKFDFDVRDSLIVADVLDSPFPPCPEALTVIRAHLERCCQESPPTP